MTEIIVRIERYFKYPDIMQQTPSGEGIWGNIRFTEEKIPECDYLVILDHPGADIEVSVNPENIFHICMEPPNEMTGYRQYANRKAKHIFNQIYTGKGSIQTHGALPWNLNKSYDMLVSLQLSELTKENKIAWITSNQRGTKGHLKRMQFLEKLKDIEEVDIRGRGIKPITDKWELLSACKYGIAYENYNSPYYWTEKIVDCFLSFTMPLYIGNENIHSYFPKESFIRIDPNETNIEKTLRDILSSDLWQKNIDAIEYSRTLILQKYQLFPFLHSLITHHQAVYGILSNNKKKQIAFRGGDKYFDNYPAHVYWKKTLIKFIRKMNRRFLIL